MKRQGRRKAKAGPGRPPLGRLPRVSIFIRVDADVLALLRRRAKQEGVGYQTLINDALVGYVSGATL